MHLILLERPPRAPIKEPTGVMSETITAIERQLRPAFLRRLFHAFLALAVLSGVVSLAGQWLGSRLALGGHSPATTQHEVVLGNDVLLVAENSIRFEEARQSGVANRLDLYLHWPSLDGYSEAARDAFNHVNGSREIIFLTFHKRLTSRDMSGRYDPIYAAVTETGHAGPNGLAMRPFKAGSGFVEEILAVGPPNISGRRFVARCLSAALASESLAPCERDLHLGEGLSVNYRFPEHLLAEWDALDEAISVKIAEMLQ